MKKAITLLLFFLVAYAPSKATIYFPPVTGTNWDTVSLSSLGWCTDKMDSLINYLGNHHTKAFILLKDGKIVVEHYYGTFTADSVWQWNSAGKSLTGFLTGLAQEQGYLNIQDSLPEYLHQGFSSCNAANENAMRIRHQLTMTTGFDDLYGTSTENHCTDDTCLVCIAPPGTRWAYHNAPYTLLHWVIDSAAHTTMNTFTRNNLLNTCGITGTWISNIPAYPYDEIYASKARAMARFGLLVLAGGKWNGNTIMHDTTYFNQMLNSSQNINPSYGYLWWLNGKSSYRLPGYQININSPIVPNAPPDMVAALGKNDQILNIVPSKGLVLVRMGEAWSTSQEVGTVVDDSIWIKLNAVFCNPTAINTISLSAQQLQLYPNPAKEQLNIIYPEVHGLTTIHITGPDGKQVQTSIQKNGHQATLNILELPHGLYLIQVKNETGTYQSMFLKN